MKKQKIFPIVIIIIASALLGALAMKFCIYGFKYSHKKSKYKKTTTTNVLKVSTKSSKIVRGYKFSRGEADSFMFLKDGRPTGSEHLSQKNTGILDANEEKITSFYAPYNPENKDEIFFTTHWMSSNTIKKGKTIYGVDRIYMYNLKTDIMTKLYEKKNSIVGELGHSLLYLTGLGLDGSKFIVKSTGISNSPGPCASVWKNGSLHYLDLANISAGLKTYTLPKYMDAEIKKEAEKCALQMGF